jgi:hypothetical protein
MENSNVIWSKERSNGLLKSADIILESLRMTLILMAKTIKLSNK